MESTQKKQKIETETTDCRQPQNTLSPFNFPDFTIKIADKKLHIDRGDLIEMSPVFRTMLTADFKEKDAHEIELPDKDPTTFALFHRHTLPGFDGLISPGITLKRKRNIKKKVVSKLIKIVPTLEYVLGSFKPLGVLLNEQVEAFTSSYDE